MAGRYLYGAPAANLAIEGRFPLYNRYHIYNFADSLSWIHGSHSFKAGVYTEYFQRNQIQPYCQFVVAPKVTKFRRKFLDKVKRAQA